MLHHTAKPPGVLEWVTAAAVAALLLALAQILVAVAGGVLPPPALTLLIVFAGVCVLALCGAAMGVVFRLAGRRVYRATLIGATLGPLAWVAMGPVWTVGGPLIGGLMGAISAAWGIGGVWVAEGLTARGRPPSAVWLWGGVSLLFAGLSRLAAPEAGLEVGAAGLLGLLVLAFCFVVAPTAVRSDRWLLGWLVVLVPGAAVLPWLLPWIVVDQGLPDLERWPPSMVYVLIELPVGEPGTVAAIIPTLSLMETDAVRYRLLRTESMAPALLGLPEGDLIAPRLEARGYATAAILPRPGSLVAGTREQDDRPGGRVQLTSTAGWMAGAPWVRGPAAPLVALVGHDRVERDPQQLSDAASRWLLGWRADRAPAPFFLVVDLRTQDARAEDLDGAVRSLLDTLGELDLEGRTMLVFATEGPSELSESRVIVVPPAFWSGANDQPAQPLWGRELSSAMLRLAESEYGQPVILPGPIELQTVLR